MTLTPLEQDVLSIVESKPGILVAQLRHFIARSKYPTINLQDALKGTDGINRAVRELKKSGYLRMKDYKFLYTTEKWHDYCRGGEHV